MKKLLIILSLLIFSSANAINIQLNVDKKETQMLARVGYSILNSNRIPHKITFEVVNNKKANAWASYHDNLISVTDTLMKTMDSEDELAGVVAHEVSHAIDYRKGVFRGFFTMISTNLNSKKYEYTADKRAVDYVVKAGYNPIAMIIALNKIAPEQRYDWCSSHPLTSRRLATIYEYIYTKYPEYLVQNEYKNHPIYQNFLITSRENRSRLEEKIKTNSKRKVKYL